MATPSTMFSTAKARIRKMRTWISGTSVRSSIRTKITNRAMPPAMHSPVPGLDQPQMDACWKPKTLSATPDTMRANPR